MNDYGICIYKECEELGVLKLKEKPVCRDHFYIAMQAIRDKSNLRNVIANVISNLRANIPL